MDKKKSILNIAFAVSFKIAVLLVAFFTRKFLIQYAGDEANGINDLFASIIGVLGIVEVGAGAAIAFSMYKPIVEGDTYKVSALYNLYKKVYRIIGFVLLGVGLLMTPFVPFMAKDSTMDNSIIYITFIMIVLSTYISYTFASRTSLIEAHKNNFVTTIINSSCTLLLNVAQIIVLMITKSFIAFMVCKVLVSILNYIILRIVVKIKYKGIIENKEASIDAETKKEITNNIKAMFMHKVGGTLVVTMDSIIISAFLGVVILSSYENYVYVVRAVATLLALLFTPLTTIVGHYCVKNTKNKSKELFERMNLVAFLVMFLAFICVYQVLDEAIRIVFDSEDTIYFGSSVLIVIVVNYFVHYFRTPMDLFKDATGLFYKDRYKPIVEGLTNLILSVVIVIITKRVEGVIIATILTNLLITYTVQGYILYKYAFEQSSKKFFIKQYLYVIIFIATIIALSFIHISHDNLWIQAIINLFIGVGVFAVIFVMFLIFSKELRTTIKLLFNKIFGKKVIENENTI